MVLNETYCAEYPYSNDRWSVPEVNTLDNLSAQQITPEERATALVIGSGGFPYIAGHTKFTDVVVVDLSSSVIHDVAFRQKLIDESSSWEDYAERARAFITNDRQLYDFEQEFKRAQASKLANRFELTKDRISRMTVRGVCQSIMDCIPGVANMLEEESREVTFVNLTNVASYLKPQAGLIRRLAKGRQMAEEVLRRQVRRLPLAQDAILVSSSTYLKPHVERLVLH